MTPRSSRALGALLLTASLASCSSEEVHRYYELFITVVVVVFVMLVMAKVLQLALFGVGVGVLVKHYFGVPTRGSRGVGVATGGLNVIFGVAALLSVIERYLNPAAIPSLDDSVDDPAARLTVGIVWASISLGIGLWTLIVSVRQRQPQT